MNPKIKTWLLDIDQSIEEIFEFLPENRNFLEYQKDLKTKKAVERNLEIIGEAVRRILDADGDFPIKTPSESLVPGIGLSTITTIFLTKLSGQS